MIPVPELFADLNALDGTPLDPALVEGRTVLVVNVASKCGLTPQYEGLERLQARYGGERFTVLGFPCNQFGGQEPGTSEEIATFCSMTYGVSFPLTEKIEVNGDGRQPALRAADRDARRRRRGGRHPVELREVPRLAVRRGARALPPDGRRRRTSA